MKIIGPHKYTEIIEPHKITARSDLSVARTIDNRVMIVSIKITGPEINCEKTVN